MNPRSSKAKKHKTPKKLTADKVRLVDFPLPSAEMIQRAYEAALEKSDDDERRDEQAY